jgi:hypothetical protein
VNRGGLEASLRIPGYRLGVELGRGAAGVVHAAHRRPVPCAVKLLLGLSASAVDAGRFAREVRALASLSELLRAQERE